MKIYVAGKWEDREAVKQLMKILEEHGHEITVDWTAHENPADLSEVALEDEEGVSCADAFVGLLLHDYNYKGLWVEMGMALANRKLIFSIGHAGDSCIFMNHPRIIRFESIDEFITFVSLHFDDSVGP